MTGMVATGEARSAAGPHVIVGIATSGAMHEQTLASVQGMIRATRRATSVSLWWQNDDRPGHCRNLLVERFLADPTKTHLLFVGPDTVVPQNGLDLLLDCGEPLACGPAPVSRRRSMITSFGESPYEMTTNVAEYAEPRLRGKPVDPRDGSVGYVWHNAAQLPDGIFDCDAAGTTFCLIAREVLECMGRPWFDFVEGSNGATVAEDFHFFRRAAVAGYRPVVHPETWCDPVETADITHLEERIGPRGGDPPWSWRRPSEIEPTLVVAGTRRRWLDCRTSEVLLRWQEEAGDRIGVRLFDAPDPGWLLGRLIHDAAGRDPRWKRVLVLGPEVIPTPELMYQLHSVDAMIVSTLMRFLIGGEIAFTFKRAAAPGVISEHPVEFPVHEIQQPFEVQSADLACALIRRETLAQVGEALSFAAVQPDPRQAFNDHFCECVREATGFDPVVAPLSVTREGDVGLFGLMRIKERFTASQGGGSARRQTMPA